MRLADVSLDVIFCIIVIPHESCNGIVNIPAEPVGSFKKIYYLQDPPVAVGDCVVAALELDDRSKCFCLTAVGE